MSDARRGSRRKSNTSYILEIILCLISITAIAFAMLFLVRSHELQGRVNELESELSVYQDPDDPYLAASEVDMRINYVTGEIYDRAYEEGRSEILNELRSDLLESDNMMHTVISYYPDDLIIFYEGHYLFYPISDNLIHNDLDDQYYATLDSGRKVYTDPEVPTETWIDVSKFQGDIDWDEVAADGIDGALIRLGYRGYSKGDIMEDDEFEDNITGALDNNMQVGVYFLSQAISDREATEEAEYVLEMLEDYDISGTVVIDIEMVGGDDGRGNALSIEERTRYTKVFLDTIHSAGYDTMIYGNLKSFLILLDLEELEDYSKWFAYYDDTPYWPYAMDMWQYTEKGRVKGIKGDVDLNIRFVKKGDT